MTSQDAIDKFAVLIDQYGSANFSDDETLQFLNQAQLERLRRLVPDDQGGPVNFEYDSNVLSNIKPLIITTTAETSTLGTLATSDLNGLIEAQGFVGDTVYRILEFGWDSTPYKFLRYNDRYASEANYFKKPSTAQPRYLIYNSGYQFLPRQTYSVRVTLIKTPKVMAVGNSPEWDDVNMNLIIEIALQYASQATRDQELLGSIQNSNISK